MIINNVKLVLENEVVSGSLEVQNGEIRAFAESQSRLPEAMDGEGGWLLPGLIELHTDNLDKFFTPRPKVDWPAHSAMSSHDALMVASGITTVLDAVAIGDVRDGGDRLENLEKMINAIEETQKRGVNRAEHRLHLRCELPHHTTLPLFEKLVQREPVTLVSLMDHSPGQRQFANREKYREYYQGKYSLTDVQMQQYEEEQLALAARWSQPNRESIAALCRARQIALASHDDATHAHVAESHQLGSVIAEFPTTFEAAEASRKHGMNVLMGAPNIVRGGSHSGNVAASELAQLGLLDILSSDYYPASLLDAAFRVADDESNRFTLPQAVKLVTKNPAQALNLQDRGVIGEGKRADLVLAHRKGNHIHIDHVWRQGKKGVLMMGKLIWLMGPSGSGKDSLLAELRLREQTQLLVAHRYITRDASAGSENHIALSEQEFFTRAGQNLLALSWHANGLYYGVGVEIDLWLHAGFDVLVNGSRAHLPQARARYQSALLPICLQVSPEILRQRLENRGRENASEINARLARAARYTPQDCHTLNNDGSLRQSVDTLLTLIHQKEKHHACL